MDREHDCVERGCTDTGGSQLKDTVLTVQAKSIPVRKDDEVLIVRGKYKGREGKVTQVRFSSKILILVARS
jgi:ribosomal protein uL24